MDEPRQPLPPGREGEITVFLASRLGVCARCDATLGAGVARTLAQGRALCLACSDLADLAFLPSGDAALTRRATRSAARHAVVLEWSRRRKRYERRGTLVPAEALARAREECAGDESVRARRREKDAVRREAEDKEYLAQVTAALARQFPGCPPEEVAVIAGHACEKHSGRVGRSAAMKDLDPEPMRLAVIAHIRHLHTQYDNLLAHGVDKREARGMIQKKIQMVLTQWSRPLPRTSADGPPAGSP